MQDQRADGEEPAVGTAAPPEVRGPDYERSSTDPDRVRRRSYRFFLGLAVVLLLGSMGAVLVGNPLDDFVLASVEALPLAALALLAYAGRTRPVALVFASLWHFALLIFTGTLIWASALMLVMTKAGASFFDPRGSAAVTRPLPPSGWLEMGGVWAVCALGVLIGAICLLPAVREWAARSLSTDPRSPVHAFAFSLVAGLTVMLLGSLAVMGGRPMFLELIRLDPHFAATLTREDLLLPMIFGLMWLVPGTMMAVGYPVVRSAPEALRRLGLVLPTLRHVFGALALAVVLVGAMLALDWLISALWGVMGWPKTDEESVNKLFAAAISPLGAVVIGVTAGLGEELAIRGALQPRLGIALSNLFFTSVHALQYGFDGLLSVFLVGLVLGVVRQRSNTTTSCIVHGVYDFILVMAAVLFG